MSDTLITLVGIGNRMITDDGIAPQLLEAIQHQLPNDIAVQLWENRDALSIAAELLAIETAIVMVDCADMGLEGGDYRWFNEQDCVLDAKPDCLSTHSLGFAEALALAKTLGFVQPLYFFAIQPETLAFGNGISPVLQNQEPLLAETLLQHLQQLKQQLSNNEINSID